MIISMNRKIISRTVDIAMALCPLNLEHRCSHIAFLIRCGKIIHIGTNSCKSHPETLKYAYKDHQKVGIHAELSVCMKSGKENLKDYSMVVLRVDRKGNLANSRPCCGCQSVIKQFNIGDVWYSDSKGEVVENA
jgi:Cytidine and deoxycytidylate deaminase zinc-binding region